jgi:hypothetical protein
MGLGPIGASAPLCLRNGELLGHSPIHNSKYWHVIHNFDQLLKHRWILNGWKDIKNKKLNIKDKKRQLTYR